MRAPAMLLLVALCLTLAACDRASEQECEAACLHYSKLGFAEEEGAEASSDELEKAWAAMQEEDGFREGLLHCVQMCEGQASAGQAECIVEAESLAEADACSGVSRARAADDQ